MQSSDEQVVALIQAIDRQNKVLEAQTQAIANLTQGLIALAASNESLADSLMAEAEEGDGDSGAYMDGSKRQ